MNEVLHDAKYCMNNKPKTTWRIINNRVVYEYHEVKEDGTHRYQFWYEDDGTEVPYDILLENYPGIEKFKRSEK